jgi:lipid II:glycine glycyltransferase (peptidoglycan interpeptide bridge formation enzyme)
MATADNSVTSQTNGQPNVQSFSSAAAEAGYDIRLSLDLPDPGWDAFLKKTPTTLHYQSSVWAQTKAAVGWRSARLIASQGDDIVAGAQMLFRSIPLVGNVAYISRAPVFAVEDPLLMDFVIARLHVAASTLRLKFLLVQPPCRGDAVAKHLPSHGFQPSMVEVAPKATMLVDLTRDHDVLLSRMTKRTRQYLRSGERKGIIIRKGSEADLPAFYQMLQATADRQKWSVYDYSYYTTMWRFLSPNQNARLTMAEYEGQVISALLSYQLGETVYGKTYVRQENNNLGEREMLVWESLRWAKSAGYHYYDFGRIYPKVGRELVSGERSIGSLRKRTALFKVRMGSEVTFCPEAYYYIYNPLLRKTYQTLYPRVERTRLGKRITKLIRGYNE